MEVKAGHLLEKINDPSDLKKLTVSQLKQVSQELRQYIIDVVSCTGGHFAASLGVVELTVALHYVFNSPYDQIVWDVGHQAYGHKILTGRRDKFVLNRQYKGISGFPKRSESIYDAFGTGHASTSISAVLGMAEAARLSGINDRFHIAVIGDGSLTGGMALEALNNAGVSNANILVILNDNRIAIDSNVGAIKEYLINLTASASYNKVKKQIWVQLGKAKTLGQWIRILLSKMTRSTKSFLFRQSNLFESINLRYFGPLDGHDIEGLIKILESLKKIPGPKILHVLTVKGKGYKPAENDQTTFHAPGLFDIETGKINNIDEPDQPSRYQVVFGRTMVELARENPKIVAITPAMPTGSSLTYMMEAFPDRTFDVGIAEQHAVTFAAGLATQGFKPFCVIYSTFLQRSYDQIVHDVCLQKLPVVFCIDRAGLVGEDGPTHHGAFDIAYLRHIPEIVVSAPMNEVELRNFMFTASQYNKGPFSIRYPRGHGVLKNWERPFELIEMGKGRKLSDGENIAVLSIGTIGNNVTAAINSLKENGISVAHYDMRFIKPLDNELLHEIFKKYKKIITIENGVLIGGFGSAILEFMNENNYQAEVKRLGIPDKFIEHGKISELQYECGLHPKRIGRIILEMNN